MFGLVRSEAAEQIINDLGARANWGDLSTIEELVFSINDLEAIIHAGAKIQFSGDFYEFYIINVYATRIPLEKAISAGVK